MTGVSIAWEGCGLQEDIDLSKLSTAVYLESVHFYYISSMPMFLKIKRKKSTTVRHQRLTGTSIFKGDPPFSWGIPQRPVSFVSLFSFAPANCREKNSLSSLAWEAKALMLLTWEPGWGRGRGDPVGFPSISQFPLHLSSLLVPLRSKPQIWFL